MVAWTEKANPKSLMDSLLIESQIRPIVSGTTVKIGSAKQSMKMWSEYKTFIRKVWSFVVYF